MSQTLNLRQLKRSRLYSEQLGIRLCDRSEAENFKWFLASILFGTKISETIATNTYAAFKRHRLLTPRKIINTGRDCLVHTIMHEGGYVRYDGRKSEQVLRNCTELLRHYKGRVGDVHTASLDKHDLEQRLLAFYGIGPVTTNIFLRELRPYWCKADPEPLTVIFKTAERLGVDISGLRRNSVGFNRVEAGLIRARESAH
ncbi:MAG: hypothetical protein OER96_01370 [Gammaproteobacteria bacterium]|nr:hypothetical protein [Gammaproteobacteria bacterium]